MTSARPRDLTLDVLRGFAVLGMLVGNIERFAGPGRYLGRELDWPGSGDELAVLVIDFFTRMKFITLFTLLFGMALALQVDRPAHIWLRRLVTLFVLGAAHVVFLWDGDMLTAYAVFGFGILAVRSRSDRALVALMGACVVGLTLRSVLFGEVVAASASCTDETARVVYSGGSFGEIVSHRICDFVAARDLFADPALIAHWIFPFLLVLVGFAAGRWRVLAAVPRSPVAFGRLRWLALGLAVGLYGAAMGRGPFWYQIVISVTAPLLVFFYAGSIALALTDARWRTRLSSLAPVGRMALTNYLLQSLVCVSLFYNQGLGWYGQVGPGAALLLAIGLALLQIPWSRFWLERFHHGPVEWLWRTVTLGQRQPFRLARSPMNALPGR